MGGIRRGHCNPAGSLNYGHLLQWFSRPGSLGGGEATAIAATVADLSGANGQEGFSLPLTLKTGFNACISCVILDASAPGTPDLEVTFLITGHNQFGEQVTETLTVTSATGTAAGATHFHHTQNAWSLIESIELASDAVNGAAGDAISIGFIVDQAAEYLPVGLPAKIANTNEIPLAANITTLLPLSLGTITLDPYYTVEVEQATGVAIFGFFVVDPELTALA